MDFRGNIPRHTVSFLFVMCVAVMMLGACSTTVPEGKPLPDMTFLHVKPLPVEVAAIDVENKYDPALDPHDVSSSFPTPPDIALRRYAERRMEPAGDEDTLKFVIEDSRIHRSIVQPAGKFTGWLGVKRKDLYEVAMKIRMYTVSGEGEQSTHSILNLRRSIAIPQNYSLADKEKEKFKFLELLMEDVDEAVTKTLSEKMNLAAVPQVNTKSVLSSPEVR